MTFRINIFDCNARLKYSNEVTGHKVKGSECYIIRKTKSNPDIQFIYECGEEYGIATLYKGSTLKIDWGRDRVSVRKK